MSRGALRAALGRALSVPASPFFQASGGVAPVSQLLASQAGSSVVANSVAAFGSHRWLHAGGGNVAESVAGEGIGGGSGVGAWAVQGSAGHAGCAPSWAHAHTGMASGHAHNSCGTSIDIGSGDSSGSGSPGAICGGPDAPLILSGGSDGVVDAAGGGWAGGQVDAASAVEALLLLVSPTQIAAQGLNAVHAAGLPWWAAIPAATLAARAVTLPLSLRGRAASAGFLTLNMALGKARLVRQALRSGGVADAALPGMWQLSREINVRLRKQDDIPSLRWYWINAAVQTTVLLSMTNALSCMTQGLWPGLTTEGALWFTDLTSPAVYLATLSTPLGTLGTMLPLMLVLTYMSSIDACAGARVPGIIAALRVLVVPLYCVSLLVPHATLLCWGTAVGSTGALLAATSRPGVAAALKLPPMLLHQHSAPAAPVAAAAETPTEGAARQQQTSSAPGSSRVESTDWRRRDARQAAPTSGSASEMGSLSADGGDAELLVHLGSRFRARGRAGDDALASACFRVALGLKPDCTGAQSALQGSAVQT